MEPSPSTRRFSLEFIFQTIVGVLTVTAVFSLLYQTIKGHGKEPPEIPSSLLALLGVAFAAWLAFKAIAAATTESTKELEPVRAERKEIEESLESGRGGHLDILKIVRLGLNHITEYYTINKAQARNSFAVSIAAVMIGLLALCFGIYFTYKQHTAVSTLSAIAGVLLQFIGGAYFYLYNRSLQQLNFFYESLIRLQDIMLALQQVEQLDSPARDKTREAVIKALIRSPVTAPRVAEAATSKAGAKARAATASS